MYAYHTVAYKIHKIHTRAGILFLINLHKFYTLCNLYIYIYNNLYIHTHTKTQSSINQFITAKGRKNLFSFPLIHIYKLNP